MLWKTSKKEPWAMQSLLQRLATTDDGGLLLADQATARQVVTRRKRPVGYFLAGLACAALGGTVAITIISFVNAQSAQEPATYAVTTAVAPPSGEAPVQGRLLWWKLPLRITPAEKRPGLAKKSSH
jgi:hypothetical protein